MCRSATVRGEAGVLGTQHVCGVSSNLSLGETTQLRGKERLALVLCPTARYCLPKIGYFIPQYIVTTLTFTRYLPPEKG